MLSQLLAVALLPLPLGGGVAVSRANSCPCAISPGLCLGDEKALKALEAWLKLYRNGKIDYRSKADITKESLAQKFGLTPKNALGQATWAGDLDIILGDVVRLDTAEAALALLEVTAIGLDDGKYTVAMAPFDLRRAAEVFVQKLTSATAKAEVAKMARGEIKVDKGKAAALQAAAVRALGLLKDPAHRAIIESALGDGDEIVRISAADAIAILGDEASALALIATIERDSQDAVLIAAASALSKLYEKYLPKPPAAADKKDVKDEQPPKPAPNEPPAEKPAEKPAEQPAEKPPEKPAEGPTDAASPTPAPSAGAPAKVEPAAVEPPESVRLAVRAAIRSLGRCGWRADMSLVRLLDDFRSHESVPALIGILERFQANPDDLKSGKSSGLLLYRAHELLVSMTGAVIPAEQPQKWRELWETEKDKIEVTKKRPKGPGGEAQTAAGGFCGIPVQGSRIIFVLDLSGSMDWPMDEEGKDGKKRRAIRLDFAKRELSRAVDAMAPNAQFTLITFNGDDKADAWSKEMVVATPGARDRFKRHVNQLQAKGGTNLWAGLESALKIKSLVYGNRYATSVDEVFVLSDGEPTVGDVTDPEEILRLVKECNRFAQVRINTIFISSATPPEHRQPTRTKGTKSPQEMMRTMALDSGGQFREL
jgi:hypothetical protein